MVSPLVVSLKRHKNIYGSKIIILSPAKLNLYLNILGAYPPDSRWRNFHRVESIMERISLFDKITVEVTKEEEISISSNEKSLNNSNNLCVKAANLIREKQRLTCGFKIMLCKKIPVGSGLGGGSSNAASTLLAINNILGLNLPLLKLYSLGAALGSDVNFFLSESKFAYACERGENIYAFEGKPLQHIIIWPRVSLSTKKVYAQAIVKLTKFLSNVKMVTYAIKKHDIKLLRECAFNALETSALSLCREMKEVKAYFEKNNVFLRVTGSGSALYAIIDEKLKKALLRSLPKRWCFYSARTY